MTFDFVVKDSSGVPRALFEVKRRAGMNARWAAQLRENLFRDNAVQAVGYFVIVTPDRLFVWRAGAPLAEQPIEVPLREVLQKYLNGTALDVSSTSVPTFELVVQAWIADLVRGASGDGVPPELLAALRHGELTTQGESLH